MEAGPAMIRLCLSGADSQDGKRWPAPGRYPAHGAARLRPRLAGQGFRHPGTAGALNVDTRRLSDFMIHEPDRSAGIPLNDLPMQVE
jgi:hypothetical protein